MNSMSPEAPSSRGEELDFELQEEQLLAPKTCLGNSGAIVGMQGVFVKLAERPKAWPISSELLLTKALGSRNLSECLVTRYMPSKVVT